MDVVRFIASFHTYDWNMNMHMVWSHFESAHGKDLSDPECGRAKYILRCHEMRHTADVPTELKSSLDQYKHLKSHHTGKPIMSAVLYSCHWVVVGTNRTFRQKKGKGIYCRVYHWMPSKKIRPLCTLAEVETLPGSCTMESHFFANAQDCSKIYVKRLACFNCNSCRCHRYRQCEHSQGRCGSLLSKPVNMKSGARDHAAETRNSTRIKEAGEAKAKLIKVGMLIGSECDNESEPYIISIAVTEEKEWRGGLLDRTWMGKIKDGT